MSRLLVPILACSLVVAGCQEDTGQSVTSTSAQPAATTSLAAVTTTQALDATNTTSGVGTGEGGEECLVGTWILDSEAFVAELADVFSGAGVGATEVTPTGGSYTIELGGDGAMTGVRDDWGFALVTAEGTINISIDGTETGTWSADDETLSVDIADSQATVSATVEADGQVFDLPAAPVDVPEAFAAASDYSCEGDVLTVTNEGITSVMSRA